MVCLTWHMLPLLACRRRWDRAIVVIAGVNRVLIAHLLIPACVRQFLVGDETLLVCERVDGVQRHQRLPRLLGRRSEDNHPGATVHFPAHLHLLLLLILHFHAIHSAAPPATVGFVPQLRPPLSRALDLLHLIVAVTGDVDEAVDVEASVASQPPAHPQCPPISVVCTADAEEGSCGSSLHPRALSRPSTSHRRTLSSAAVHRHHPAVIADGGVEEARGCLSVQSSRL